MSDQHRFGNDRTESAWPRQPRQGDGAAIGFGGVVRVIGGKIGAAEIGPGLLVPRRRAHARDQEGNEPPDVAGGEAAAVDPPGERIGLSSEVFCRASTRIAGLNQ